MRTLVIKRDADLEALRSELLVSGLSDSRSGAALESIRTLNPHLDFARLKPGMVLDDLLTIACGEGAVRLLEEQRAGAKAMSAGEFLRGRPVPVGTVLR